MTRKPVPVRIVDDDLQPSVYLPRGRKEQLVNSKIIATAAAVTAGVAAALGVLPACAASSAPAGGVPSAPSIRPLNGGTNIASVQWTPLPDNPYSDYSAAITTFCYAGVQFYVTESKSGSVSLTTAVENGGSTGQC